MLGDQLPNQFQGVQFRWDGLHLSILWHIWKWCNANFFDPDQPLQSKLATTILIWLDMTNYITNEWKRLRPRIIHSNDSNAERIQSGVTRHWGTHLIGPAVQGSWCFVPAFPAAALLQWVIDPSRSNPAVVHLLLVVHLFFCLVMAFAVCLGSHGVASPCGLLPCSWVSSLFSGAGCLWSF